MKVVSDIPARQAALRILTRVDVDRAFVDKILDSWLRRVAPADRSFVREIVLGTTVWRGRIDWTLERFVERPLTVLTPWIRNILRMGVYQILFLDRVPDRAVIDESVKLAHRFGHRGVAGFVNAVLRKVAVERGRIVYPDRETDPVETLAIRYSHPVWMVRRWIDRYGIEETEMLCRANNQRPVLTIRVNRLRTTVTGLQDRLRREGGIETGGVEEFEDFLAVPEPEGLFSTAAFKEGWFIVQDPSAGLPVLLLDPQPEETILDMCSAPGGKAASMAILTGDRARIIAVEKHPGRVVALRENLDRLGLSGVRVLCTDALTLLHSSALLPSYFHSRLFDKILIDAPCSGTGTLSKKSDARWHRSEEQVHELVELQKRLLETAARLVKPGGVIVYSTCSIEWEENEGVIGVFLRRYPTWRPESVPPPFQKWGETMVRTFRHRDGVDGSFCLRLTNV